MRKKLVIFSVIINFCIMTACGTQAPTADINMTQMSEMAEADQNQNMTQIAESEETDIDEKMTSVSQINGVGTLEQSYDEIYSSENPEKLLATVTYTRLLVNDNFAGAEKINTCLYDYIEKRRAEFENTVRMDEEFLTGESMLYSYDSNIRDIKYFDNSRISFIQEDYEYLGGAHGFPIREAYVFDLTTGERLLLPDIISNTEDELKDIVTKYFSEIIDKAPDEFWPDAKETVHDSTTLDTTDFVLTDDGICFYRYPYDIAPYVGGFPEVTIPYSEFQMKLEKE